MSVILDPRQLPLHSVAGEAALPGARLTPAALRQRFASTAHWMPERSDEYALHQNQTFRPAAVLIPLQMHAAQVRVILTERSVQLSEHAGQISFPGGRCDAADLTPDMTALREAEEEIGLSSCFVEVLGVLPEYLTGTGYRVTPVVALVDARASLHPAPDEVAHIFTVPLDFLMDGRHHERRIWQHPRLGRRLFYAMPYQNHFIWGATAGMLRNLYHFLRAQ